MDDLLKMSDELLDLGCVGDKHLLYHSKSERDIFLGNFEYEYLKMLDGKTHRSEISSRFSFLKTEEIDRINQLLCNKGLICGYEKRKKMDILNFHVFSIKDRFKSTFSNTFKNFVESFFWVSIITVPIGIAALVSGLEINSLAEWILKISCNKIVSMFFIIVVSIFCHEIGHAIMAKAKGAVVVRYDFGFLSLFPCVSTVISGLSRIKNEDRIKICMAGIINNLWLVLAFLIGYKLSNSLLLEFAAVFNIAVILFNLIIFIKADGWQIINILAHYDTNNQQRDKMKELSFENIIKILKVGIVLAILYEWSQLY